MMLIAQDTRRALSLMTHQGLFAHSQEEPLAPSPLGKGCVGRKRNRPPETLRRHSRARGRGVKVAALPAPTQWRRRVRAQVHKILGTLTLTLSRREGRPLSWAPSADAVAGGGDKTPSRECLARSMSSWVQIRLSKS